MNSRRRQEIEELFEAALDRPQDERPEFLASACEEDDELRTEVEALLAAHDRSDGLLEGDASAVAGLVDEGPRSWAWPSRRGN